MALCQTPITSFVLLQVDPLALLVPENLLNIKHIEEILPLLDSVCEHWPGVAIFLFGSRACGKQKEYSDWDLGISSGSSSLDTKTFFSIQNLIDEKSENLPRSVDVVNLDQAPIWFLQNIQQSFVFLKGNVSAQQFFLGVMNGIKKSEQV
ncbi:MAG: nucleotidyltransferase domain-containing protein [Deltaproteobacteria bacterium]|nr:nucleotidyltransferase domain-containing protein [Deltaproteobacteria bacterium]